MTVTPGDIPFGKPETARRGESGGFTLIELLVVIAIISLLVSILLPSLTAAKELAVRTQCMGRERAIHLATLYYLEDHGSKLFTTSLDGTPWGFSAIIGRWWHPLRLGGYTEEGPFYLYDPSHSTGWWLYPDVAPLWFCAAFKPWGVPRDYPHCAMNDYAGGKDMNAIPEPTKTPLYMCDATWKASVDLMYWDNMLANAHNDGTTFIFCDGHAGWIPNLGGWSAYENYKDFPTYPGRPRVWEHTYW